MNKILSFVEEGIHNEKANTHRGGRIEIHQYDKQWGIDEHRRSSVDLPKHRRSSVNLPKLRVFMPEKLYLRFMNAAEFYHFEGKLKIAFDVDMTLIDETDKPIEEVVAFAKECERSEHVDLYIHSGGGMDYAKMWAERLGFGKEGAVTITPKGSPDYEFDIVFDDALDNQLATIEKTTYYVKSKLYIKV